MRSARCLQVHDIAGCSIWAFDDENGKRLLLNPLRIIMDVLWYVGASGMMHMFLQSLTERRFRSSGRSWQQQRLSSCGTGFFSTWAGLERRANSTANHESTSAPGFLCSGLQPCCLDSTLQLQSLGYVLKSISLWEFVHLLRYALSQNCRYCYAAPPLGHVILFRQAPGTTVTRLLQPKNGFTATSRTFGPIWVAFFRLGSRGAAVLQSSVFLSSARSAISTSQTLSLICHAVASSSCTAP